MKISGKKGYYRRQDPSTKMSKDGKEIIIKGSWHRIYAEITLDGDDVYVPVIEEGRGPVPHRFSDLKLECKPCRMIDLPGQKVSFMRNSPDKEAVTKEGEQYLQKGVPEKHFGRIGFDVRQVYIPFLTKAGDRSKIRFDNFIFEEKSKGDK